MIKIRKNGSASYPWQAVCTSHRDEQLFVSPFGMVAFNTKGVGNRTWKQALHAALAHHQRHHAKSPRLVEPVLDYGASRV